jgi:ATP-dependent Clp protease ATP-binding subunit ClpX
VNTRNILFICGGAFEGLDKVVERRIGKNILGFGRDDERSVFRRRENTLALAEPEDLMKYGLIPELVGRLPVVSALEDLDKGAMVRILREPRNALTKQYAKLLDMEGVELVFAPAALEAIADLAIKRKTGARGLRSIMETVMRNVMFEIPSLDDVRQVVISQQTIEQHQEPEVVTGDSIRAKEA